MWFAVLVIISEQCTAPSETKWQPGHVRVPQQKSLKCLFFVDIVVAANLLQIVNTDKKEKATFLCWHGAVSVEACLLYIL